MKRDLSRRRNTVVGVAVTVAVLLTVLGADARHRWRSNVELDPSGGNPIMAVRLGLQPPWRVLVGRDTRVDGAPLSDGEYEVAARPNAIYLQNTAGDVVRVSTDGLRLQSGAAIEVNGHRYRGTLLFRRDAVVNRLPLQDYLRGVVGREIGRAAELEALKTQAVVARSYALANMGKEVTDDTRFQVYCGVDGENDAVNCAVDETEGQILTWRGHLARDVCYHSTCGGHTEDNENVFLGVPIPYLRGVACTMPTMTVTPATTRLSSTLPPGLSEWLPHTLELQVAPTEPPSSAITQACERSSLFRWVIRWPLKNLPEIAILRTTALGRVARVRAGSRVVSGDNIRRALCFRDTEGRVRSLYSTAFTLTRQDDLVVAVGSGWGHGVGLCQWGARGMAAAGLSYEEILTHYFPGTRLATLSVQHGGCSDSESYSPSRGTQSTFVLWTAR